MKTSLFLPTAGYLLSGNVFRNKVTHSTLRQYYIQRGRNSVSSTSIHKRNRNLFQSSVDKLKYDGFGYLSSKYCTVPAKKTQLMNFNVVFAPSFINLVKIFFTQFTLKNYDSEFNLREFLTNSKLAMEVVTTLISESRFSELEGLLTSECREEVERNVKNLDPRKRRSLAMKADDVLDQLPLSLEVIKVPGVNNAEKVFAEIFVLYRSIENLKDAKFSIFGAEDSQVFENYTAYNAKFIKELTPEVEDQWTINAINVFKYAEHMPFNHN